MPNNQIKIDPLNEKSGLKVGFWNVNGLPEEKSKEDFFLKQTQLFDIIFLSETWHRKQIKYSTHMGTFMKTYTEKIKKGKEEHLGGF